MPNRLVNETSPYLLQHAKNPVDWYPWGEEAFAAATELNRPIFLSVGYSTCYWCHVMERESFENEAIAKLMNDHFICIKVDREERPDVDQLYMTAVQLLTQHGGWPMSVFLLPDRRPIYGGTYFPPTNMHGRPGFPTLLNAISEAFRERRDQIETSATQLRTALERYAEPETNDKSIEVNEQWIDSQINRCVEEYEPNFGGFGRAPKFPRETLLELLLSHHAHHPDSYRAKMIRHTLDAMADGGIRDQLGGGFHRYSTDDRWLVPHFEIMLYDNALLAWCYLEAYRQFEAPRYARIARGILDFVLREMTDEANGSFFTAFDAEVDTREGLTYLWSADEVRGALQAFPADQIERFLTMYGLSSGPNFADPHHGNGQPETNILHLPSGSDGEDDPTIARMRDGLIALRSKRKQPMRDTKILTSWNALMIRAFAVGGERLNEPRYIAAASRAADFILKKHRRDDGRLLRTSRERGLATEAQSTQREEKEDNDLSPLSSSVSSVPMWQKHSLTGCLDDYAFLTQALNALHVASGETKWQEAAHSIAAVMQLHFADPSGDGGLFYTDADASSDLIIRHKIAGDSPLPSGNAIAATALLSLDETEASQKIIDRFAAACAANAESMSAMILATYEHVRRFGAFTVAPQRRAVTEKPKTPEQLARDAVTLEAGWISEIVLRIDVKIRDGYHINANLVNDDRLIATKLEVIDLPDIAIDYPPAESKTFAFSDRPLNIYSGNIAIDVKFNLASEANRGLAFAFTYQACDETACLAPVTQRFDLQVG